METQDKDVMANIAMIVGILIILAVVIFMVTSLLSTIDKNSIKGGDVDAEAKAALLVERIKPIGSVTAVSANAEPVVRSGAEIVASTCNSCHGTGVLDAPKIGDAAAWTPRLAQGMDTLMSHAADGFNAMPARGGDGSLSDEDLKKAVIQMLQDSGQDVSADAAPAAAAPAAEEAAPVVTAAVVEEVAPVAVVATAVVAVVTEAVAPAVESSVAEAEESDTAIAAVSGGSALVDSSGEAVASAQSVAVVETPAPVVASGIDPNTRGKEIYKMACFSCHDMGIAGAPKIGDAAAWAPRIAAGFDSLYNTAINGRGAMPPKGGRVDMSDDEIKATVQFMVSMSQ